MDYSNLKVPNHVAIIVDGNGRWAKMRGLSRSKGHDAGYKNLKELGKYILSKGIKVLSLYLFSTENFKRSEEEVGYLMNLFLKMFRRDIKFFMDNNIKIGDCSNEIMLLGQTGNTKFGWSLSLPLKEINTFIDESANTLIVENAGFTFDQGTKGGVCLLIFNENTNKYDLIDTICVCEYLKTAITSLPRFESTGEHEVEIELLDNAPLVYMFANTDVQNITQLKDITSIGNGAFNYCSALTEITIPNSVTSIGYQAFENCDSLTSITIPDNVTSIGESAFLYCSSLTEIIIPDGVTKIAGRTFNGCESLTSVTIPNSVTEIDRYAFGNCTSLASVYCKAITPPTGGSYMFDSNASNRKIYVPMASVDTYKSAQYWSNYADAIEGYNF